MPEAQWRSAIVIVEGVEDRGGGGGGGGGRGRGEREGGGMGPAMITCRSVFTWTLIPALNNR